VFVAFAARAQSIRDTGDVVTDLPTYGKSLKNKQFAGFARATPDGKNRLHYWFVEGDKGNSKDTPVLIWLNGGPGASSLTGLLAEKLGPQAITANATLEDNPDALARLGYHVLAVDNPVGSGYSSTDDGAYVTSEEEMRTQFVFALRGFYALHPEYAANPLWVTGESYAGKYVPNIALEIAVNATEIPLAGVVIGNGLYNLQVQYPTLGKVAFGAGVIDEADLAEMERRQQFCLEHIASTPATAGDFCENVTVRWLYGESGAGELFYYDIGLADAHFFDTLTDAMGEYLNREDVKKALHAENASWVQADESGPVSDALMADWAVPSDPIVSRLLQLGVPVRMYNGVRDMSSCNHIGNLEIALGLDWSGAAAFRSASNVPWPSRKDVQGHIRGDGLLQYATVLRTGHLVPTVVPASFAKLLPMLLAPIAPPTGPPYHNTIVSSRTCFQTNYIDEHYRSEGFSDGACPYQMVLDVQTVAICNGHSETNVRYCPVDKINITITKMGEA